MRFGLTSAMVATGLALVMATGTVAARQSGTTQSQSQEDEFLKGVYVTDTPGLTQPVIIKSVKPRYTPDAMRAKIQGGVEVQVVVLPNGEVDRARIVESLDRVFGLDDEALKAAKQWTFNPGVLEGKNVPVAVTLSLQFRFH